MPKVKHTKLTFIFLLLSLVLFLFFIGWLKPIESVARKALLSSTGFLFSIAPQVGNKTSESLVLKLEQENKELNAKLLDYDLLLLENTDLREQLDFKTRNNYKFLGASVVGRSVDPLRKTIIVDRGANDGVTNNNPVIARNGDMIGKVIEFSENTAVVQLLSDHQSRIAATLVSLDRSIGLVEGGYGISTRMGFIPQNEIVSVGDRVVTSGLEEGVPHGLYIGQVEAVEKEAYQPFQTAIVQPNSEIDKIRLVSIVIP
jgi:rod shape-determining protein MreC